MQGRSRHAWSGRHRAVPVAFVAAMAGLFLGAWPVGAAIHPGDATVRTREVPLDTAVESGLGKDSVRCPPGMRAVSGGAALHREGEGLTAEFQAKLIGSAPLGDGKGWRGAAMSFEAGTTILLRVTVACLPTARLGGYAVRTKDFGPAPGVDIQGALGCGRGRRMVTGGVWWSIPGGIYGSENLNRSTPSGDGRRWRAAGFTYGAEEKLRLVVVCLPAATLGKPAVRHRDYPGGGIVASDVGGGVSCGAAKRALAGGADWREEGASSLGGSLNSTTVRPSLRGWYAAGDSAADGIALRVLVTCVPK